MKNIVQYICILSFLFFAQFVNAQSWEMEYPSISGFGHNILVEPDGEIIAFTGSGDFSDLIVKTTPQGDTIWTHSLDTALFVYGVFSNTDGSFTLLGQNANFNGNFIQTRDTNGDFVSQYPIGATSGIIDNPIRNAQGNFVYTNFNKGVVEFSPTGTVFYEQDGYLDADSSRIYTNAIAEQLNGYIFTGYIGRVITAGSVVNDLVVGKTDLSGNLLWTKTLTDDLISERRGIVVCDVSGNIYVAAQQMATGLPNILSVRKFDQNGNILWQSSHPGANPQDICFLQNELYILAYQNGSIVYKYSAAGSLELAKNIGAQGGISAFDMDCDENAGFAGLTGGGPDWLNQTLFLARIDQDAAPNTFLFNGTVLGDNDGDCVLDGDEFAMKNSFVFAENATDTFITKVEINGTYNMYITEGSYDIRVSNQLYPYSELCPTTSQISGVWQDTVTVDFAARATEICPALWLDLSKPFIVPCQPSFSMIQYCNNGTAAEDNVQIEVTLPAIATYNNSVPAATSINGQTLLYDLGTLQPGDCGKFQLFFVVDCDSALIGQTFTISSSITPDTLCQAPNPLWSGASNKVGVECVGDSVHLYVTNSGNVPNSTAFDYIVIEDNVIMKEGSTTLSPLDTLWTAAFSNGATYRITAEQEPNHPMAGVLTAAIEGCTASSNGIISTGFLDQFPESDDVSTADIEHATIVASGSTVSKNASPIGLDLNHFIEAETAIEYQLFFQNQGATPVSTVVVSDKISENLDIESLIIGGASHPFTWKIESPRTLVFEFSNLYLPTSNADFINSYGFVSFKIKPKKDLAIGTVLSNQAMISFNGAQAMMTEEIYHEIGEQFLVVSDWAPTAKSTLLHIFPNPMIDKATLQIDGYPMENGRIEMMSADGKTSKSIDFQGNTSEINRNALPPGIYFIRVFDEAHVVGNGKIIID